MDLTMSKKARMNIMTWKSEDNPGEPTGIVLSIA